MWARIRKYFLVRRHHHPLFAGNSRNSWRSRIQRIVSRFVPVSWLPFSSSLKSALFIVDSDDHMTCQCWQRLYDNTWRQATRGSSCRVDSKKEPYVNHLWQVCSDEALEHRHDWYNGCAIVLLIHSSRNECGRHIIAMSERCYKRCDGSAIAKHVWNDPFR